MNSDIRWIQRFQNFTNAFSLLNKIVSGDGVSNLTDLEKTGLIHIFQLNYDLVWKTLRDKMEHDGVVFDEMISPRYIFKLAYHHKYIDQIEPWLAMIDDRNQIARTYDPGVFGIFLPRIKTDYYPLLNNLHTAFMKARSDE